MSDSKSKRLNPMIITDPENGREYTLEFNRRTVSKVERAGLDINKIDTEIMTMISLMFWGAFQMHHPGMTQEQTDKILFDTLHGLKPEEVEYLGQLYAEPIKTLIASEDEAENPRRATVKFQKSDR